MLQVLISSNVLISLRQKPATINLKGQNLQ